MASLGEGHEIATHSTQADGLTDGDVLASPTLTNFNERALMNGVVPITVNDYHSSNSNRLSYTNGNCATSFSGTTITVAAGTVLLDGMFYEVASIAKNITASGTASFFPYNSNAVPTLTGTGYERTLLVYVDPTKSGFIGYIYGDQVNTASGIYPQSPKAHLAKHTIVLASCRLTYSSGVAIASCSDKRVFIRPGPYPISALTNHASNGANPGNDFIAGSQNGTLPVTDLGFLFARNPRGLSGTPNGIDQTHLFFQSDKGVGEYAGGGGVYQLTPVHRQSKKIFTWNPAAAKTITFGSDILFKPLQSQDDSTLYLIDIVAYDASDSGAGAQLQDGTLIQSAQGGGSPVGDFYVNSAGTAITIPDNNGGGFETGGADKILVTYTHAGHN